MTSHGRRLECANKQFEEYVTQSEHDGSLFVGRPVFSQHSNDYDCYFREINGNFTLN